MSRTSLVQTPYRYGFHDTKAPVYQIKPGLSKRVVEEISHIKNEPQWMRDIRARALAVFEAKPMPTWGGDLSSINFDKIIYYSTSADKQSRTWDDVPTDIKKTFDRLGVPEAERKMFAGVGAQYDSDVIYHNVHKDLEKQGVIFCDTDTAVQKYPDLVKKYFSTVVPIGDNKFAALNTACWSGGSFIYLPKGVKVAMPLQAYFRINSKNFGQFERTLIIADVGSDLHYIEGCFAKGTLVTTNADYRLIENIKIGDRVLTHTGKYRKVYHTQKRPYTGSLYTIRIFGDPSLTFTVTAEHPFLCSQRQLPRERNKTWETGWRMSKELKKLDYLAVPVCKVITSKPYRIFEVEVAKTKERIHVPMTKGFFTLMGYYLAEGSISSDAYLNFSFGAHEMVKVREVERLLREVFGIKKNLRMFHKTNHGVSVVICSVRLARFFKQFGTSAAKKHMPQWAVIEASEKQAALIRGYYNGDGNYYKKQNKHGFKELFRMNTVSPVLARQVRDILLRLGVVSIINARHRKHEGRQTMYTIGIGGDFMEVFGRLVNIRVNPKTHQHRRASMFGLTQNYAFYPIRSITRKSVANFPVFNFSVEKDESYIANSVAVHNCTAPVYSTDSLHAAVVEIIAHKNAHVRYTTIQNWSSNVYNLVTKRARAEENAFVEWIDGNLGSKLTMKYPSVFLHGRGARADVLSVALAGPGQHQDAGAKVVHLAPDTISSIVSKSVSFGGGRTAYRGLAKVVRGAERSRIKTQCDALILDPQSRSDTYPTMAIEEENVRVEHEATVSRIGEKELFYLQSRGLTPVEATSMVVAGFFESLAKVLPIDYAIELNRLIEMEMEGSVG